MKNPPGNKTDIADSKNQSVIDNLMSVNQSLQKELEQCRKANTVYTRHIERLKNLVEKIRDGFARSEDAITIVDLTNGNNYLKIFDMNPTAQKIFGVSRKQIENGIFFKEIISDINYDFFVKEHLPLLKKGKTVVSKDDVDSASGCWDSTIYPMKDKKGVISYVASISRNVTVEHENKKLSAILQAAIDSLPFEIWIRDADGYEIYQNKASREVVGDMIGTTLNDLSLPEDTLKNHKATAKRVLDGETVNEDFVVEKEGKSKWINIVLNPIRNSGKTIGYTTILSDITYRKTAEISLRSSEERFRLIARQSKNLLYDYNPITGGIEWDGAIEEVTGYSPEEYKDVRIEQWLRMIHPDDKDDILTLFKKCIKEDTPFKAQYRYKKKDGDYIWIEQNSKILEHFGGKPSRLIGVMKDITDRKESDELIYKNQKLLSDSQRIAHIGAWEYYYRDDMLLWNEESYKIVGVERTEHIPAIEDFIHLVHPDDKQAIIDHFERTVKENEYKDIEYRIIRPDGEIRTLLTVGALNLDERGNAYRSFGIIQDITERKHAEEKIRSSEEKLRKIFDTSKDGIIVVNREMGIMEINNAAISRSGYTYHEVLHRKLDDLLSEEGIAMIKQFIHGTDNKKEYINVEGKAKIKGGGSYPVGININAIPLDSHDAFLLMTRDISERKQMERELLTSVISTEEKERLYFSQELHDGLGPLLSAAKLYVEWLADPTPEVDQGAVILDIWKILEEANKSIRDISFKLSPHTLQNYGISEALKAYANKIRQSTKIKITINDSVKGRFDNTIETILYRVMCECINNTIKHANAKNISIRLKISENMLNATYRDDGTGFNFEHALENRKGIGLLSMRSRVRAVNGTLTVDSTPGKGTRIEIKIPVGV
jgi:PAS domain S-box-containing protein